MEPIQYGSTHCPHCEREYAPAALWTTRSACDPDYCYSGPPAPVAGPCDALSPDAQELHLITVLQERDALRAELANVHSGQLSLLALGEGGA